MTVSFKDSIKVSVEKEAPGVHHSLAAHQVTSAVTRQSGQSIEEIVLVGGVVLVHSAFGS